MPPATLAPKFLKSVQQLVQTRENIRGAHAQLVEMFVRFCVEYDTAYREARRLGNSAVTHLNAELGEDASTVSRWRKVAEVAGKKGFSKTVTRGLPASQEIIVELSRRELAKPGTLQRLVKTKRVTPDTTVKDVRALFARRSTPTLTSPKGASVSASATVTTAIALPRITLTCSDAALLLDAVASVLKDGAYGGVSAFVDGDKPLYEQGKAALGPWWKTNGNRFTFSA